jgi:hypothetical protein
VTYSRTRKELIDLRDLFESLAKQPDSEMGCTPTLIENVKATIAQLCPWLIVFRVPEPAAKD